MTFLKTHNLPATACFVLRCLSSRPEGIDTRDLAALLAPPSLQGPAGKEDGRAGGLATDHTIEALQEIGLIVGDRTRLLLDRAWREKLPSVPTDREILRILRGRVFDAPKLDRSWRWNRESSRWNTGGANDFLRAASWFLSQDPLGPPFTFGRRGSAADAERLQRRQFKRGQEVITNATRWADFERWACAFGIARRISLRGATCLSPDPTDAIAEELASTLEPSQWYSINDVLARLAQPLPILGTGVLRSRMLQQLRAAPERVGARTEDPALSQAIIILAGKKFLEFRALSDATDQRLLWDQPHPQSITHLRLEA